MGANCLMKNISEIRVHSWLQIKEFNYADYRKT
jgi:hypothetical protein